MLFFFHFTTLAVGMNSFLKFFARVKNSKQLKAPRARTTEIRAKMLKADWFKNDITRVDKNGIATGESGDIILLILLPHGIQLFFI